MNISVGSVSCPPICSTQCVSSCAPSCCASSIPAPAPYMAPPCVPTAFTSCPPKPVPTQPPPTQPKVQAKRPAAKCTPTATVGCPPPMPYPAPAFPQYPPPPPCVPTVMNNFCRNMVAKPLAANRGGFFPRKPVMNAARIAYRYPLQPAYRRIMPRLVSSRPVSRAVLPVPQAATYRQCVPIPPFSKCPPIMMPPPPPPPPQPMMIPQYPMPQVRSQFDQFSRMPKLPFYNGKVFCWRESKEDWGIHKGDSRRNTSTESFISAKTPRAFCEV